MKLLPLIALCLASCGPPTYHVWGVEVRDQTDTGRERVLTELEALEGHEAIGSIRDEIDGLTVYLTYDPIWIYDERVAGTYDRWTHYALVQIWSCVAGSALRHEIMKAILWVRHGIENGDPARLRPEWQAVWDSDGRGC